MAEGRNIVIAMDGSEYADYAFDWYIKNFWRADDHVILLHVPEYTAIWQSPILVAGEAVISTDMSDILEQETKRIKQLLKDLGDKLRASGIGGKVRSVGGHPGEVVTRIADEEKASAIITGTRGMGTIRRTLLGSVSDYILHHSHIPVIICRHQKDKDHQ